MKTLAQTKQVGMLLEIIGEGVNVPLLERQLEFNGCLNDFNIDDLPRRLHLPTGDISLVAIVQKFPEGREVQLAFKNPQNTYFPFCDFPLAEKKEDLNLLNQVKTVHRHLALKYVSDISIELGKIPITSYRLGKINIHQPNRDKDATGEVEILEHPEGEIFPISYWNSLKRLFLEEPPDLAQFYSRLIALKKNLDEGVKNYGNKETHLPLFIDISNLMCMIYEHNPRTRTMKSYQVQFIGEDSPRETHLEDLYEKLFLDYVNTSRLVGGKRKFHFTSKTS